MTSPTLPRSHLRDLRSWLLRERKFCSEWCHCMFVLVLSVCVFISTSFLPPSLSDKFLLVSLQGVCLYLHSISKASDSRCQWASSGGVSNSTGSLRSCVCCRECKGCTCTIMVLTFALMDHSNIVLLWVGLCTSAQDWSLYYQSKYCSDRNLYEYKLCELANFGDF